MAQASEQLAHRSSRHPLPGRLPPPESRIGNSVAKSELGETAPPGKNAENRTRSGAGRGGLFVIDSLGEEHAESRQILVIRARVVLPSVHEHRENDILFPGHQGIEPL